jgi:hypothetical protein
MRGMQNERKKTKKKAANEKKRFAPNNRWVFFVSIFCCKKKEKKNTMGSKPSVPALNETISRIIAKTVMSSVQKATSGVNLTQAVELNCSTFRDIVAPALFACLEQFKGVTNQLKICDPLLNGNCRLLNVNLSQYVVSKISAAEVELAESALKTNLELEIRQQLSESYGLFNFSALTSQSINAITNQTVQIFAQNAQTILSALSVTQSIQVNGADIQLADLTQSVDFVANYLQTNNSFVRASNDLAISIRSNILEQNSLLNKVLYSGIGIVAIVLIVVLAIIFIKKSGSKGKRTRLEQ